MSDIRDLLIDTTTKIMKDLCDKNMINDAEKGIWPSKLWSTLENTGITSVGVPEEHGGSGGTIADALSILRIAGKFAAPIPLAETLLAKWLLTSCAITAPEGPLTITPTLQNGEIQFQQLEDGWILSGTVRNVGYARLVNGLAVLGRSTNNAVTVALVHPADCRIIPGENLAGEPRDQVIFENVKLPVSQVSLASPQIDEGWILQHGALTRASLITGALERILELTVQYCNERVQFGRQIGRFQAIQQQMAIFAGEVIAARMATDCAVEVSGSAEYVKESAIAKIRTGQAVGVTVPIAHQVHGAIGFTDEHALHQSTRRLWSWRDEYGTESEWADKLGRMVFAAGHENLWAYIAE